MIDTGLFIAAFVLFVLAAQALGLQVETIGSRFGALPASLPRPSLPSWTWASRLPCPSGARPTRQHDGRQRDEFAGAEVVRSERSHGRASHGPGLDRRLSQAQRA